MAEQAGVTVDAVDPDHAWRLLEGDPTAQLIDVRTRAEWSFVGLPDLSTLGRQVWPIEWLTFPAMAPNPDFLDAVAEALDRNEEGMPSRLFFICRSGARSLSAARAVAEAFGAKTGLARCTNVAEGFEGDLDASGHRGAVNGWKMRGLPWRQN
ncbi:rhodanese-like domain-containing protein [Limibaculum sp. M0105]|uniref:Rhodanese-like domain-containing protein n=1 Tax=Thermohalobaculum xanthum TaxID=2753746 RepID=A0A8J7M813_9RHOB|nr:rhodanese-like domain-containing protein [Thermohalobaculum xanthum]MBK0400011.1 rhodanese-like domain-containing protein [Thermohalobaculum xanthum]